MNSNFVEELTKFNVDEQSGRFLYQTDVEHNTKRRHRKRNESRRRKVRNESKDKGEETEKNKREKINHQYSPVTNEIPACLSQGKELEPNKTSNK